MCFLSSSRLSRLGSDYRVFNVGDEVAILPEDSRYGRILGIQVDSEGAVFSVEMEIPVKLSSVHTLTTMCVKCYRMGDLRPKEEGLLELTRLTEDFGGYGEL